MFRSLSLCSALALAAALSLPAAPASALTMKECSAKYQDAKKNDTLKGMKWNDFRKAECSDDDASEADAAAAEKAADAKPAAPTKTAPASTTAAAPNGTPAPKSATKPVAGGRMAFPTAVSDKYSSETPGKARMHTCLDQYRANKAAGAEQPNWIAKGGGYYSQCNTKLKEGA